MTIVTAPFSTKPRVRTNEAAEWTGAMGSLCGGIAITAALELAAIYGGMPALAGASVFLALMAIATPELFLGTLISSIVFQNALCASMIGIVRTSGQFQNAQAVNFVVLVVGAATGTLALLMDRRVDYVTGRRLLNPVILAVGVLIAFTAWGAVRVDVPSALAYLRLFATPLGALATGIYLHHRVREAFIGKFAVSLAVALLAWCLVELFAPKSFYSLMSYPGFFSWKFPGLFSMMDAGFLEQFRMWSWLNLTGVFNLHLMAPRLFGPTAHPISFAYVLATVSLLLVSRRSYLLAFLLWIPLLMIGAKGPIMLGVLPTLCWAAVQVTSLRAMRSCAPWLVLGYALLTIVYGVITHDIHVHGLLMGAGSVVTMPIGHGLGYGGNLSSLTKQTDIFQTYYHGTEMAVPIESAVGVMAFQLGLFVLPLLHAFRLIGGSLDWATRRFPRLLVLYVGFMVVLCNGCFQEEAFAPVAAGFVFLLVGFLLPQETRRI